MTAIFIPDFATLPFFAAALQTVAAPVGAFGTITRGSMRWTDSLSLYAGVRRFDALTHEVRRQTRARTRRDETSMTYFAVGFDWRF